MADRVKKLYGLLALLLAGVLAAAILLAYSWGRNRITTQPLGSFTQEAAGYVYEVEEMWEDGKYLYISGYALQPGVEHAYYNMGNNRWGAATYNNNQVALVAGENVLLLNTVSQYRDEVAEYWNGALEQELEYRRFGFTARVERARLGSLGGGLGQLEVAIAATGIDGTQYLLPTAERVAI